ncbi:hypothetical protein L1994_11780 [Methanomicrobium antiquum]|uniref:Uncharacterized protein n=1 Tax=Methanomicrobium antiquum TaxID=487686 RepID=A0AAF0FLN0_9EURY|nr:hypothetical protein [Methanomicrobium antiquum]MDD3978564.1 hypothetical protein [Methanomicrobium sp.]WFN36798.1 hypothetical protein L1994_11780 [Methanomicrobium antiquum]
MQSVKEKMKEIIYSQPDDSSFEEIIRELIFERMMKRGLLDSQNGRVISNAEMKSRIKSWQR